MASWYLRLRDPAGRDPMWGLVRVEIAHPDAAELHAIGDRADEVSRWILAEIEPARAARCAVGQDGVRDPRL